MKKWLLKIMSIALLLINVLCLFSCGEEKDCLLMEHSNEYDRTVTVKIDDKIVDSVHIQYDGEHIWWDPTPFLEDLKTDTVSRDEHQVSLEFKEKPIRCTPQAVRVFTKDWEWGHDNYLGSITDFQWQGKKAQAAFDIPEGLDEKYSRLIFEIEVAWHRHEKDVCYFASGLYYFGVDFT